MPSPFAMKLRKHLRNLRLENVTQLGCLDRVVDFRFGSGGHAHHLILELYAQGNLILCDSKYQILALLRTHEYEVKKDGEKDDVDGEEKKDERKHKEEVKVRVGNIYPVTFATTLAASGATEEGATTKNVNSIMGMNASDAYAWAKGELLLTKQKALAANVENQNADAKGFGKVKKKGGKKGKKAQNESVVLKALLLKPNSGVYHYGPSLIEHCIWTAGLDPLLKLSHDNIEYTLPEASWGDLITSLREEGSKVIESLTSGGGGAGYILYKPKPSGKDDEPSKDNNNKSLFPPSVTINQNPHADKTLLEFQPHLLHQHKKQHFLKYKTFAVATDEFFSHLSSQRVAARADAAESAARERLAKIQADQRRRVEGLVKEQERWRDSAQLVESHAEDVDRALNVIHSALETGMDWDALERLVSVEQENENPIALLIYKLVLEKDEVVLALPDIDNWDADADPDAPPPIRNVTVSIKESAHGNARNMFAAYRASKEKEEKTVEASTMALKAAEAKARAQLAQAQKRKAQVQVLPQRKTHWFEKFAWYV